MRRDCPSCVLRPLPLGPRLDQELDLCVAWKGAWVRSELYLSDLQTAKWQLVPLCPAQVSAAGNPSTELLQKGHFQPRMERPGPTRNPCGCLACPSFPNWYRCLPLTTVALCCRLSDC